MTTAAMTKSVNQSPYVEPDGYVRYEEKDLIYIDRKVQEAAKMGDPVAQREHLEDVVELYESKYGVEMTVEWLLENADMDLVYVEKMLQEDRDDIAERVRRGEKTSYSMDEIKEWIREEFGYVWY